MTMPLDLEQQPWQPTMDHEVQFNPFVNSMDRVGQLETQAPLEDSEPDSIESEKMRAATAALVTSPVRHTMIAQAAYLLSERRGFVPNSELQDWLVAEAQIDVGLKSRKIAERFEPKS